MTHFNPADPANHWLWSVPPCLLAGLALQTIEEPLAVFRRRLGVPARAAGSG
jgi:hypothetical protein